MYCGTKSNATPTVIIKLQSTTVHIFTHRLQYNINCYCSASNHWCNSSKSSQNGKFEKLSIWLKIVHKSNKNKIYTFNKINPFIKGNNISLDSNQGHYLLKE